MTQLPIYCLTYKNPSRKERMLNRFNALNLTFEFVEGIDPLDPSVVPPQEIINIAKSLDRWKPHSGYGCMLGHFLAIDKFLETGAEIGIICEDDVLIRKDLQIIPI